MLNFLKVWSIVYKAMKRPTGIYFIIGLNILMIITLIIYFSTFYIEYKSFQDSFRVSDEESNDVDTIIKQVTLRKYRDFSNSIFLMFLIALFFGALYIAIYALCSWGLWNLKRWALWGEITISALTMFLTIGYLVFINSNIFTIVKILANATMITYLFLMRNSISRL